MEEIDFSQLPKKERKKLKREMKREEGEKKAKIGRIVKLLIIVLLLGILGVGGWFGFRELSKPLPGQVVADQGRKHVLKEEWEKFSYNSNPPTSGPHDAVWTKAGVYETPQGDGHLVHSLEHGYVIISYNCEIKVQGSRFKVQSVFAHETEEPHEEPATSSAVASPSSTLSDIWQSSDCQELKKNLSDLANEKKLWKLIVVSRPKLDSKIALTAWDRIDKMNTFDKERITVFIDAFRNKGPEKTME